LRNAEGGQRRAETWTTTFTVRDLRLLLQEADFSAEDVYGCEAGKYARRAVRLEDWELMAVARRM
jgi:hypothetical protein